MDLDQRYPAIADLRARARRRVPHFIWEYLDSATGTEATQRRNRARFDAIRFVPSILHGDLTHDLSVTLFGRTHPLPFGVSPLGLASAIWPDAERRLARAATAAGLPYTLSTVAGRAPEKVGPLTEGGGWFQLYPARDRKILDDMLKRARDSGFRVLVLTADVPSPSRRERQIRGGLTHPPRLTPRLMLQSALRPAWSLETMRHGIPRMELIDSYAGKMTGLSGTAHAGYMLRTSPDWDYLRYLRETWDGPLMVKGVLSGADAAKLEAEGVDGIWVSNHAGRQFDAAPASIEALPEVRAATSLPVILDSGIEGGLDILRALALGADFVMMGRPWHFALAALGDKGPPHLVELLRRDMESNMGQLGAATYADLKPRLVPPLAPTAGEPVTAPGEGAARPIP